MKLINRLTNIFKRKIKNIEFQYLWRCKNDQNLTEAGNIFSKEKVQVGQYSYGTINVISYNDSGEKLKIGNYCSIAGETKFILNGEHEYDRISTFPFSKVVLNRGPESTSKGSIIIDDDVWIGYGTTIMSGVHVGQGAVIAAGAVVTKDVPPYAVVGGVPAKVIKYRFSEDLIEELLKVDYSKLTQEIIEEHIDDLYEELKTPQQLDWLPKKG